MSMRVSGVRILWDDTSHQEGVLPRVARLISRITSNSGIPVYPELEFWRVSWNQWNDAVHFSHVLRISLGRRFDPNGKAKLAIPPSIHPLLGSCAKRRHCNSSSM